MVSMQVTRVVYLGDTHVTPPTKRVRLMTVSKMLVPKPDVGSRLYAPLMQPGRMLRSYSTHFCFFSCPWSGVP